MQAIYYAPWRPAALLLNLGIALSCGCDDRAATKCKALELLGDSALDYRDVYRQFPPPVVVDEDGRRIHSWRVLLLPFIEANAFFNEYDFDAAWSDPPNADLADGSRRHNRDKFSDPASVRTVYQPHLNHLSDDFTTGFLMVARGDESMGTFKNAPSRRPGDPKWAAPVSIKPDELIIVQVKESDVHWMEPRDLVLGFPAPKWGIAFEDVKDDIVASVLITDGRVTYKDREATLELLMDRQSKVKMRPSSSPAESE